MLLLLISTDSIMQIIILNNSCLRNIRNQMVQLFKCHLVVHLLQFRSKRIQMRFNLLYHSLFLNGLILKIFLNIKSHKKNENSRASFCLKWLDYFVLQERFKKVEQTVSEHNARFDKIDEMLSYIISQMNNKSDGSAGTSTMGKKR